jgi:hypothetical protein
MGTILTKNQGGGITDHGLLNGLSDDDHPQYILVDGSRAFSSTVAGVMPTETKVGADLRFKSLIGGDNITLSSDSNEITISGSAGDGGTSGTSGSSGTSGADGTSGSSGTSGIQGDPGTSGSSGISGADGTSGSSGTSGADGTSGSSGTSGADGTSGSSGSSGTSGADRYFGKLR